MMPTNTTSQQTPNQYWEKRQDLLYYHYIDYIMRCVGAKATSIIDVGSNNCPYLDWFDWIPERVSVDIRNPYRSATVQSIKGDIHAIKFDKTFDICTCFQVLEHVPEVGPFAKRLLEIAKLVVVSVPYQWSTHPRRTPGHVHDPVTYENLCEWMGRPANYSIIVEEPFQKAKKRLIAIYDADCKKKFTPKIRAEKVQRSKMNEMGK